MSVPCTDSPHKLGDKITYKSSSRNKEIVFVAVYHTYTPGPEPSASTFTNNYVDCIGCEVAKLDLECIPNCEYNDNTLIWKEYKPLTDADRHGFKLNTENKNKTPKELTRKPTREPRTQPMPTSNFFNYSKKYSKVL